MVKIAQSVLLGLFAIFLVGCETTTTNQLPYISPVSPTQDLLSANGDYELKFFVVNPTINTFIGNLSYGFDENCLTMDNVHWDSYNRRVYTQGVQVNPKSQFGITKEI